MSDKIKTCTICNNKDTESNFIPWRNICRLCMNKSHRDYYHKTIKPQRVIKLSDTPKKKRGRPPKNIQSLEILSDQI